MNTKNFEAVIEAQIKMCKDVLIGKAMEYAQDGDRLHNFKRAAGMMGCDPKEALAGMMAKHTISVYDMCRDGQEHSRAMWDEKITDHINYLLLLKAIIVDQGEGRTMYEFATSDIKIVRPGDTIHFDIFDDKSSKMADCSNIFEKTGCPYKNRIKYAKNININEKNKFDRKINKYVEGNDD